MLEAYFICATSGWLIVTAWLLIYSHKIAYLKKIDITEELRQPSIAIVVAVRNEEAELEKALSSLCNLRYDAYRIIVVNDRSTDNTPAILQRMAADYNKITTITISGLPPGWLGKNHALYQGYLATNEEWLLFTDADVVYGQFALKKAMTYASQHNLDHLTVLPEVTSASKLFVSVMNTFATILEIKLRPWAARNPKSSASIGVGAFNLVKRSAYEQAGTHQSISLRPDDDLKLGENIKKAGLKQDVLYGDKEISLAWYNNLGEFVNGLMKNAFSISNYHLPLALLYAVLTLMVFVVPIPLMLFFGPIYLIMAFIMLCSQVALMVFKKGIHGKWWHALMIPFAGLVMTYIIIRSSLKTVAQNGIYWRDSFYSLDDLKKQR